MRPWDPATLKILTDAHVEALRGGGARRRGARRVPRRN